MFINVYKHLFKMVGGSKWGNDEKSVNGIIINSGIVGSATEKWDQDLQ